MSREPLLPDWATSAQPSIDGDGLTLRPWAPGDADFLAAAYRDPLIRRWHIRGMTRAEALEWIDGKAEGWHRGNCADWAVVVAGEPLARIGFRVIETEAARAELAYWVTPAPAAF